MDSADKTQALQQQVAKAFRALQALRVTGGNSKAFYGRPVEGQPLTLNVHSGIVQYDPSELVITARAGTQLIEVERVLADNGQMLGCESPRFGDGATVGGMVATGLSGPRRPFAGAVRDFVLGATILNGRGERLRFGGQVIKNVAGYDVSRLMVGSLGCLGVLLEVSMKVVPAPVSELTVRLTADAAGAIERSQRLIAQGAPISGAAHYNGFLYVRLSGGPAAVRKAQQALAGEQAETDFWESLREHRLEFFKTGADLWRLSLPATAPPLDLPGDWLMDWGGALRWLTTDAPAERIRSAAAGSGGHATLFKSHRARDDVFQPLDPALMSLHRRLKTALDPAGILNPGRMYEGL